VVDPVTLAVVAGARVVVTGAPGVVLGEVVDWGGGIQALAKDSTSGSRWTLLLSAGQTFAIQSPMSPSRHFVSRSLAASNTQAGEQLASQFCLIGSKRD